MRTKIRLGLMDYLRKNASALVPEAPVGPKAVTVTSQRQFAATDAMPVVISVSTGRDDAIVLATSPRSYTRCLEVLVTGVLSRKRTTGADFESVLEAFGARIEAVVSEFDLFGSLPLSNWRLDWTDLEVAPSSSLDFGGFHLCYVAEYETQEPTEDVARLDDFRSMGIRNAAIF